MKMSWENVQLNQFKVVETAETESVYRLQHKFQDCIEVFEPSIWAQNSNCSKILRFIIEAEVLNEVVVVLT